MDCQNSFIMILGINAVGDKILFDPTQIIQKNTKFNISVYQEKILKEKGKYPTNEDFWNIWFDGPTYRNQLKQKIENVLKTNIRFGNNQSDDSDSSDSNPYEIEITRVKGYCLSTLEGWQF